MQDFKKRGYGAWLYTINDTGVSGGGGVWGGGVPLAFCHMRAELRFLPLYHSIYLVTCAHIEKKKVQSQKGGSSEPPRTPPCVRLCN